MKSDPTPPSPQEIELKLALVCTDALAVLRQLVKTRLLSRRKSTHLHLHNVYYDTPECDLQRARAALRLRRVDAGHGPRWWQTLKLAGAAQGALSQRGEWEVALSDAALSRSALPPLPWSAIDHEGRVFERLVPCFVSDFERTLWRVRRRDASVVEVALDVGELRAGAHSEPILELEIELLAGPVSALFDVAQQLATQLAFLPLHWSKSERGFALAQGRCGTPLRAQPTVAARDTPLMAAAQASLNEMFCQFSANLYALRSSDDPEVVHQARVGWRRFKSACRFFQPVWADQAPPTWNALQGLLDALGQLRDLDVARTETLPALAAAYGAFDHDRAWQRASALLVQAAERQRTALRTALAQPSVGASLLALTQWLGELSQPCAPAPALRPWVRQRVEQLQRQFRKALKRADSEQGAHRSRILAKRLRYAIESWQSLLPTRRAQAWLQQSIALQTRIGAERDLAQASKLLRQWGADSDVLAFVRGVAAGRSLRLN